MKVLKPFTCKVTKKRHLAGSIYEGERAEELTTKGFLGTHEKVEVKTGNEKKATKPGKKSGAPK